jgi:hypothetical protein
MPFCPKCETEYREGFKTCAGCGEPLVDSLPSPPEVAIDNEPLEVVYLAPDQFLASDVKLALETAGIPIIEQLGVFPSVLDGVHLSITGYYSRILTFESRAEEAKRIVSDFLVAYEGGDLTLPEDSPPG